MTPPAPALTLSTWLFDRSIADAVAAGDTARADDRRLLRAYFCDPAFRAKLTDWVARENGL